VAFPGHATVALPSHHDIFLSILNFLVAFFVMSYSWLQPNPRVRFLCPQAPPFLMQDTEASTIYMQTRKWKDTTRHSS
jgi:hypothetical protein